MQSPPTVYLINDNEAFNVSLVSLISSIGLETAIIASGGEFLQNLDSRRSGCVVIDLCKPHLDGMRVLDELERRLLPPPVIVLTEQADVRSVVRAAHHGVIAFLLKQHASRTEILDAIQTALKHDSQQRSIHARREELRVRFAALTTHERQVLDLLLSGDELLVIAEKLEVSRRTVELRRAQVMKKLKTTTFPALVALVTEFDNIPSALK